MSEIYTAILFEEDFINGDIEYKIEVFAKMRKQSQYSQLPGEPVEDGGWDVYEVLFEGMKMDVSDIAHKLYYNEMRMPTEKLFDKLIQALNEQGEQV